MSRELHSAEMPHSMRDVLARFDNVFCESFPLCVIMPCERAIPDYRTRLDGGCKAAVMLRDARNGGGDHQPHRSQLFCR
jgi:hypothetical protein